MITYNRLNTIVLQKLIKKICNESTIVVAEDVIGATLEALHSFIFVRGNKYTLLLKYLEVLTYRYFILRQLGFDITSEILRNSCMNELNSCSKNYAEVY